MLSLTIVALGVALVWWIIPLGAQVGSNATATAAVDRATAAPPLLPVAAALAVESTPTYSAEAADVAAPLAAEASPSEHLVHTVAEGETFEAVAALYGVSAEEIAAANGIAVTDALSVGQELVIPQGEALAQPVVDQPPTTTPPAATEPTPTPTPEPTLGPRVHVVASGDTLGAIATRYGVPSAEIAAANGITLRTVLRIGQELVIPGVQAEAPPPAPTAPAQPTPTPAPVAGPRVHVVASGDTIGAIATRYGVPSAEIAAANNLSLTALLRIGQELVIPGAQAEAPPPAPPQIPPSTPTPVAAAGPTPTPTPEPTVGPRVHVVASGDMLGALAVRYGVSAAEIAAANNLSLTTVLRLGQELVIPAAPSAEGAEPAQALEPAVQRIAAPTLAPTPTPAIVRHVVQRGDTLGGIAVRYGVSSADIATANNIRLTTLLSIGQELTIPGATAEPTPEATPAAEAEASPTPTVTPSPTSIPLRIPEEELPYRAPRLLGPRNGLVLQGSESQPILQWASVGILAEDEWYQVSLWVPASQGAPTEALTRATFWRAPRDLYPRGRRGNRFEWQVTVVRVPAVASERVAMSPPSARFTFTWR